MRRILKRATEIFFHPQTSLLKELRESFHLLCQFQLIGSALGSFVLEKIPRPQLGSERKSIMINSQCLHKYKMKCYGWCAWRFTQQYSEGRFDVALPNTRHVPLIAKQQLQKKTNK